MKAIHCPDLGRITTFACKSSRVAVEPWYVTTSGPVSKALAGDSLVWLNYIPCLHYQGFSLVAAARDPAVHIKTCFYPYNSWFCVGFTNEGLSCTHLYPWLCTRGQDASTGSRKRGHIMKVLTFSGWSHSKVLQYLVELEGVQIFGLVDSPPLDSRVPVDSRVQ